MKLPLYYSYFEEVCCTYITCQRSSFRDISTNEKLAEIGVWNAKESISMKNKVSFIVNFCPGKQSFSLDTVFNMHHTIINKSVFLCLCLLLIIFSQLYGFM